MTPIGSTSSNIRRAIGFIVYSSCRTLTRFARAHDDLDDREPPNSSHVTGLTGRRHRRTLRAMTGSNRPRGHRTASPEFERMNANGLMGLHGDDLRIAADMEALVARVERPSSLEDHELHPDVAACARCRRRFTGTDSGRRRGDGEWVHQFCG